jgi:hypothetical protein
MSMDPPVLGVDLCIVELYDEGMIGTSCPRIQPQSHLSLAEWLDMVTHKGLQEVSAHQPTLLQPLDDITQGFIAYIGLFGPHHTPIWVEGRGGYL